MDSRIFIVAAQALGRATYGPSGRAKRHYRAIFLVFLMFFALVLVFSRNLFDFIVCLLMVALYVRCLTLPDLGFRFSKRTTSSKHPPSR
jgi:hypothetical protein